MSFVWWDVESSGVSTAFDQILQLAAVRTDANLDEIARFEIRSRLLPWVVPAPGALKVTGQSIDDLLDRDRPSHYEMVCRLRQSLGEWCPSIFIGYNSLRFDEELLRQAFYQCLHPPYLTNTGGNGRADALHLVRAVTVLYPGVLTVPSNDKGGQSFKLDRFAPANGFDHANAHDALADVEALIHICRIIREECPALWSRFLRFARKPAVEDFIRKEGAFLLLEFFPVQTGRYVVTPIGSDGANVTYAYDLSFDPDELRDLDDDELTARMSRSPRPLRKIRRNAAPCLCPLDEAPEFMLSGVAPAEWLRRADVVRRDRAFVERLTRAAMAGEMAYEPSPHVELQIHAGFWSNADTRRLEAFHHGSWWQRADIADTLEDPRLRWLARRIIFAECPQALAEEHRATIATETAKRMLADQTASGGWMTLSQAEADLDLLSADAANGSPASLHGLKSYLFGLRLQMDRLPPLTRQGA